MRALSVAFYDLLTFLGPSLVPIHLSCVYTRRTRVFNARVLLGRALGSALLSAHVALRGTTTWATPNLDPTFHCAGRVQLLVLLIV